MARRQRHAIDIAGIPRRDDMSPRIRVAAQAVDEGLDLVDLAPVRGLPMAPLMTIDGAEISLLVRPFVPDADSVLLEVADIGVALQEPQQLVNDRAQVQFFGGQRRKAGREIEAHLPTKYGSGSGPGTVGFWGAVFKHMAHQIEILFHFAGCRDETHRL